MGSMTHLSLCDETMVYAVCSYFMFKRGLLLWFLYLISRKCEMRYPIEAYRSGLVMEAF